MDIIISHADIDDAIFLCDLEKASFSVDRRSNSRSIRFAINSPFQQVFILKVIDKNDSYKIGACTLFCYKKSLRIYSLAILPDFQGMGYGKVLMEHIIEFALLKDYEKLILEVDSNDKKLYSWYEKYGFKPVKMLNDYYEHGKHAVKMQKILLTGAKADNVRSSTNIIVLNNPKQWKDDISDVEIISARQYLSDSRFSRSDRFRVFNLCNSYKNHSIGYYVSLLASARNHRIIPSVISINDYSRVSVAQSIIDEVSDYIEKKFINVSSNHIKIDIIFGDSTDSNYSDVAKKLYSLFEIPLFTVSFEKKKTKWVVKKVKILSFDYVLKNYSDHFLILAYNYFQRKRFNRLQLKSYKYDMGILVNPDDQTPPSNALALEKFKSAAEKNGFFVEFITRNDYSRICEFDALFIRETTAVDNHTYKFARRAYMEGIVVMDDPWSILRCSNKLYLYERLEKARVRQPGWWQIIKNGYIFEDLIKQFSFPIVLKVPEGCFSIGVYKVSTPDELKEQLDIMFKSTEIVIAQEFLKTDFDWRIGVLNNKPLYACKYYMAHQHWQIYNWSSSGDESLFSGDSETVSVDDVPVYVINTAIKAASVIGNGLYGVDIKDISGKSYVIEVNDNPSIDSGVEDVFLGEDIYEKIMQSFYQRIEHSRNNPRFLV